MERHELLNRVLDIVCISDGKRVNDETMSHARARAENRGTFLGRDRGHSVENGLLFRGWWRIEAIEQRLEDEVSGIAVDDDGLVCVSASEQTSAARRNSYCTGNCRSVRFREEFWFFFVLELLERRDATQYLSWRARLQLNLLHYLKAAWVNLPGPAVDRLAHQSMCR
tara:strand:- start:20 stop:523 length:504 start_codon:yes stop_codon:yes gene_type:complete